MSESLGKHEVERPKYSISRSADHRNTSDNMDQVTEDVVTAAQIQALPALGGYVALAGDYAIARVTLPIRRFGAGTVEFQVLGNTTHIVSLEHMAVKGAMKA